MTQHTTAQALGSGLLARLDELSEEITARVLDGAPGSGPWADEVRAACQEGLGLGLRQLAGRLPDDTDRFVATRAAARRHAQRGQPLETALRAQRISGQVVWQAIVDSTREEGLAASDLHVALAVAGEVWAGVDAHAASFVEEFHRESRRLLAAGARSSSATLADLVSGRCTDPRELATAADELGVAVDGPVLVVLALATHGPASDALPGAAEALDAQAVTSTWTTVEGARVGLVPAEAGDVAARVRHALTGVALGPVGISPVVLGLARVPQARCWAETAARSLRPGVRDVVPLEERLPEALVARSPDLADLVVDRALAGLLDLPDADRAALLQTLEALVAADWSPTRAAAALWCHRNTVLYRQQRIEALTGQDLSSPRARLLCALALDALLRRPEPRPLPRPRGA